METSDRPSRAAFTVREVAKMLGCSERTVASLVASGQLPSLKIGGLRRITPAHLEELLARRAVDQPGPSS
jgi:excisionase family DNA binding protein